MAKKLGGKPAISVHHWRHLNCMFASTRKLQEIDFAQH